MQYNVGTALQQHLICIFYVCYCRFVWVPNITGYQQQYSDDINHALFDVGTASHTLNQHEPSAGHRFYCVSSTSEHDTLIQFWFNIVPSATLGQH